MGYIELEMPYGNQKLPEVMFGGEIVVISPGLCSFFWYIFGIFLVYPRAHSFTNRRLQPFFGFIVVLSKLTESEVGTGATIESLRSGT